MKRSALGCIAVLGLAFAGCGGVLSGNQADLTKVPKMGTIDTSIPRTDRAKQKVIYDVLVNLQEGYPAQMIPTLLKGIRFDESQEQFLEGASSLERWDFEGKPSESGVPVVLYFSEVSKSELKKVQRTYKVKGSGSRFVVSRG